MTDGLEAGIVTGDVESLSTFYRDCMGFRVDSDMSFPQGRVVRMSRGMGRIKLYGPTDPPRPPAVRETWHAEAGFAYASLLVDDADALCATATAGGANLLHPVTAHRPGARYALIADPQGNVWEILEER
jgi:predicted enzyme related to lactoylglutathione lyase